MPSNSENKVDHNTSEKSENAISDPIIFDENTYDFTELRILEAKILSGLS